MESLFSKLRDNNLFKNIFNLSILQVVSAFLSLALIPILARVLEPTIFGLVMFIHLFTSYFIWFAEWGFSQGGTQKIAIYRLEYKKLSKTFNEIYSAQIFLIIILIVPLYFCINLFQTKYQFDNTLVPIIIFYFALSSLFPVWFLNGMERVTFAVIVQIYPKFFALLCVFFLIKQPDDFNYYFISLILGLLLGICHSFFVIYRDFQIKFNFANPFFQLRKNLNYFITSFSKTMGSNIIPFFLGLLTSIEIFGFFSLADKIKSAVLTILNPIYQSVFPRMCHVVNQKSYYTYLKKYAFIIISLILTLSFLVFLLIEPLLDYFVGQNYQFSSKLLKFMIPAIILNSLVSILFYFILIPFDLSKSVMKIGIFQFLFVLIISYPIINYMESYGAILILTISEILFLICYLFIIFKYKLLKN